MAYDDLPARRQDADMTDPMGRQPRFGGETSYQPYRAGYVEGEGAAVPPAMLDDVFDDPVDGAPGRDRLGVHWVWELLLLIGVGALILLTWQAQPEALRGENLSQLLVVVTGYLLLGIATSVTLRAGVPNLAVGPVAAAAGVYLALRGAEGVVAPTVVALVAAATLGAVVALVVVVLQVPAWAATLAGAAAAVVWLRLQPGEVALSGQYDPTGHVGLLFIASAAVGILGGLVGTLKPVRRVVGRFRPVADPADRRGVVAALLAGVALLVSMVLAVVAGVILAAGGGAVVAGGAGAPWLEYTLVGLAVALVGGTSAFGRRGGVFGTTLAALALVLFDRYQLVQGWSIALLATTAAAIAGGLMVTRLVERFGRPRSADPDGQWSGTQAPPPTEFALPGTESWGSGADSWTSSLPAQQAGDQTSPWGDRWGR